MCDNETWTITFGDRVENHAGMEIIGDSIAEGFTSGDLIELNNNLSECELINLEQNLPEKLRCRTEAHILIIRDGIRRFLGTDMIYQSFIDEVKSSKDIVDKKAFMRGHVVNKHARWNLCYGGVEQEPDYEKKKGRIVAFNQVPCLDKLRGELPKVLGQKAKGLLAELNYYYDINKCGIGFHGDGERKIVVGVRVGATMNLVYQWYHQSEKVGEKVVLSLNEGDIYVMSEKAVGTDWKLRKVPTLRHSAGCKKYTL